MLLSVNCACSYVRLDYSILHRTLIGIILGITWHIVVAVMDAEVIDLTMDSEESDDLPIKKPVKREKLIDDREGYV